MSFKRSRDDFEPRDDYDGKKQHIDPAAELIANVCKDIRRIGENNNIINQVDDISYISNPIVAEFEQIDNLRTSILSTLYAVVIEQPQKITPLSVLVLICNAKNFLVSKYVVEYFHAKMQTLLDDVQKHQPKSDDDIEVVADATAEKPVSVTEDAGIFNNLKSILKFLATLSPIIQYRSVVAVFKQFLQLAVELQDLSDSRTGVAEEIYFNTLMALPYLLSNDVSDEMVSHVNELMDVAATFNLKSSDESSLNIIEPFDAKSGNFSNDLPYQLKKMAYLIYPALVKLQGEDKSWENFKGKLFINYADLVDPIIKAALDSNTISNEIVTHPLPQLSLPSLDLLKSYQPRGLIDLLWYKHPRPLFQVYNLTTDFETVPSITSYYGLFFKDLSFDILTNLSFNQKEASIQLSILDLFFAKMLFAPPGSSIDQLTNIHKDNEAGENLPPLSTWKIEDVAVESILTMIFQLPAPLHYEIYYYTVLISCCRESPESIAPVFGRAIRFFYKNLEMLDYELKIRFLDWMTTQISNFEFSWKWDEWVEDSKKLANFRYHPRKNFIKNLIAKEIRLSNKARIKESFVTVTIDDNDESKLVYLDEFYKYLNISLFPNESDYIINYDSQLYGEECKSAITEIVSEKKESLDPIAASPQEELLYNFSSPKFPLHEVSGKVYEFVISNWKPNEEFKKLHDEILEECAKVETVIGEKFLINVIFQTYAYVGSRSIYSIVSILNRDITKLKFVSGAPIKDDDYQIPNEFKFEQPELSAEEYTNRQTWVIESIFRIWVHQPQIAFLILEYLIEFKILNAQFIIEKCLDLDFNLIIENVSCMESINRILSNLSKSAVDELRTSVLLLFKLIVRNLNELSSENPDQPVQITKEISEEQANDPAEVETIDRQWLFYEYRGLLKSYLRKFEQFNMAYLEDIKQVVEGIVNVPAKNDVTHWIDELQV